MQSSNPSHMVAFPDQADSSCPFSREIAASGVASNHDDISTLALQVPRHQPYPGLDL
jgi:hypothetical protein